MSQEQSSPLISSDPMARCLHRRATMQPLSDSNSPFKSIIPVFPSTLLRNGFRNWGPVTLSPGVAMCRTGCSVTPDRCCRSALHPRLESAAPPLVAVPSSDSGWHVDCRNIAFSTCQLMGKRREKEHMNLILTMKVTVCA